MPNRTTLRQLDRSLNSPFELAITQFLEHIALERGLSENYIKLTNRALTLFMRWLENSSHAEVDPGAVRLAHLTDYLAMERKRGLAPASIKTEVAAFRLFFRFLKARGLSARDPAQLLKLPRVVSPLPQVLSESEAGQLLEVDFTLRTGRRRNRSLPLRDRAILELLYASGIRNAELAGARLADLNLEQRTLRITGKGSKTRIVLFGSRARLALEDYIKKERAGRMAFAKSRVDKETLFLSWNGQRLTTVRIWQLLKESAALAGIKKAVFPHLLRHSCATHMLRRGADLLVIKELLGHSDLSTTAVYTHLEVSDLKAVHRKYHPRP